MTFIDDCKRFSVKCQIKNVSATDKSRSLRFQRITFDRPFKITQGHQLFYYLKPIYEILFGLIYNLSCILFRFRDIGIFGISDIEFRLLSYVVHTVCRSLLLQLKNTSRTIPKLALRKGGGSLSG